MKKALRVLAPLTLIALGAAGIGAAVALERLPGWIEHELQSSLADSPEWDGAIGSVDVDLWNQRIVARDIHVQAAIDRKVLRTVECDWAVYDFAWSEVVRGRLHLRGIAASPVVKAGVLGPREPKQKPAPNPGWFRFQVDTAIADGTWVWIHPDGTEHSATNVIGVYERLGTVDGPGRLEAFGRVGENARVYAEGEMDFFNAHRDAIDLALELRAFDPSALQGMDRAYLATEMLEGVFDADVAFTLDKGLKELSPPYRSGLVGDSGDGWFSAHVRARDILWGGLPIEPVRAGAVDVTLAGPIEQDCDLPWTGGLEASELAFAMRRSQLASFQADSGDDTGTPPSEVLATLPAFAIPSARLDGVVFTWIDDNGAEPIELSSSPMTAKLIGLNNLENGTPTQVSIVGDVLEGQIAVQGSVGLSAWPPPSSLSAELRGAQAGALVQLLRPYLPSGDARGVLDASGSLKVDENGSVEPSVQFSGSRLWVGAGDWQGDLGTGTLDLFGGRASLGALTLSNSAPTSIFDEGKVDAAQVTWDPLALFDEQEVRAAVTLVRPHLALHRPPTDPSGGAGIATPKERFQVDIHARDGSATWTDPTIGSTITLAPFQADIVGLGTMRKRAHWTISGDLARGGHIEGTADIAAFAGPGADPEIDAHATLTGLDLEEFAVEAVGYAQLTDVGGRADLTVDMSPEDLVFSADGHELRFSHPVADLHATRGVAKLRVVEGQPPALSGSLHGATAHLRPSAAGGGSGGDRTMRLALPAVDLTDSTVVFQNSKKPIALTDTWVRVRDLTWPLIEGEGSAEISASVLGGEIEGALEPGDARHDLRLVGRDIELALLNPWLAQVGQFDLSEGRGSLYAELQRDARGRIHGDARARIRDLDVFQSDDFGRGPLKALREAAIGTVLQLADKDNVIELTLDVDTDRKRPVDAVGSVLDAVGRRFHLSDRDDAAWAAFDDAIAPEAISALPSETSNATGETP